jgi:hypothetical protein
VEKMLGLSNFVAIFFSPAAEEREKFVPEKKNKNNFAAGKVNKKVIREWTRLGFAVRIPTPPRRRSFFSA